jgi:fructose-1,6-bisphosphatase II
VAGALLAATVGSGVDLLMGVGGIPEGLIGACAVRATGGNMLGRLAPQSAEENQAIREAGLDTNRIMTENDLVGTNEVLFAATGVTEGPLLDGIRFEGHLAVSNSMIIRGHTHTRRTIHAEHRVEE